MRYFIVALSGPSMELFSFYLKFSLVWLRGKYFNLDFTTFW